jgi:hypothetical protein
MITTRTRLRSGKLAQFDVDTDDWKWAQNEVRMGMTDEGEFTETTPLLALIPDCGRDLKGSVLAHRVGIKDPLQGALDVVTAIKPEMHPPVEDEVPNE